VAAHAGQIDPGLGSAVIGIGHDQFGRIQRFTQNSDFCERSRDQRGAQAFAEARNCVQSTRRQFAQEDGALAQTLTFGEEVVQLALQALSLNGGMEQGRGGLVVLLPQ